MTGIEQFFNSGIVTKPKRELFEGGNKESWSQRAPHINGRVSFGGDTAELGCSLAPGRISVERKDSGIVVLAFEAINVVFRGFRFDFDSDLVELLETDSFSRFEIHESPNGLQMFTGVPEGLKPTNLTEEQLSLSANLLQSEAFLTWQDKIEQTPNEILVEQINEKT
jgi:hypothetical protein